MPTSTSRVQVVTQHAAKACLQQSHRRSSTIPRITPHWSGLSPIPPQSHSVLADTPQHFAAATSIQHQHSSCSVQALAPAPGELPSATPSSQQIHTQHAGRWPPRPRGSRRGFGHIWHRCALRAFLPLRRLLLTSARSAQATTRGGCRTERLTALRRELRALPRQVSFQRNHRASSPLHNCSCTQAIAVVRPLA